MTTTTWMEQFRAELDKRGLPNGRIDDEVRRVREFLTDSGEGPEASFGDPIVYASQLAGPDDEPETSGAMSLTILAIIALFTVFGIAATRWIDGQAEAAPWAFGSGAALLVAVAALSVGLVRRANATALRSGLSSETAGRWSVGSTMLLVIPWAIVALAVVVVVAAWLI